MVDEEEDRRTGRGRGLRTPLIVNAVLLVGLLFATVLLVGLPVEEVLSVFGNPAARVAIVALGVSIAGLVGLSVALYVEMREHQATIEQVEALDEQVRVVLQSHEVLSASVDGLEDRIDAEIERMHADMARERERMRSQLRAFLDEAASPGVLPGAPEAPDDDLQEVLER